MTTRPDKPKCPANGLGRAAWMREAAAEYDDCGDTQMAAYCRSIAASIERRELHALPLVVLMEGGHGLSPR